MTTIPKVVVERQHLVPRTCEFCFVLFLKLGLALSLYCQHWGGRDGQMFGAQLIT